MSRHEATGHLPAVGQRIADQIVRHVLDLRASRLEDAAEAAAARILADRDIADGLRAARLLADLAPRLAELDARHQPREWAGSSTGYVCTAGCGAYPCEVRRALDGAQPAAVAS